MKILNDEFMNLNYEKYRILFKNKISKAAIIKIDEK